MYDFRKFKSLLEDNTLVPYLSFEKEQALKRALQARNYRIKRDRQNANKHRSDLGHPLFPGLSNRTYADDIELLVIMTMNAGLRKCEILSLTWTHINFEREFVTVKATNAKSGKTRHIPLNLKAKSALLNWKPDCESVRWFLKV